MQQQIEMAKKNEKPAPKKGDTVKEMEHLCSQLPHHLFQVVTLMDLSTLKRAIVHKGRLPSIELEFKIEPDNEESPINILEFTFTGDIERQLFLSEIIKFINPIEDDEVEENKEQEKGGQDSDDSADSDVGNDEFEVTPLIYD